MSPISARIVRREDALAGIEPGWWELWRRAPAATPFQSPAWLLAWWRHFAPGDLFTIVAEQDGRMTGLAPFYLEDGALGRRLLPVGISVSDYHDVLLDPARAAESWRALIATARAAPDLWERWDWEELMPQSAALALPWPEGSGEPAPQSACPVLELAPGPLDQCLPKTKRRKLALARNRAARRGEVTIEKAGPDTVAPFIEHLFRLHALRWRSQGEDGVLADDLVQRFHREAARGLEAAGLLRLFTFAIEGQVVGVYYGFHHGDRAYAYLSGLDPDYEFESPGTLLMAHAMTEAIRESAGEFHFLRGQEAYKYSWGAHDRWNQRRTLIRSAGRDAAA